MFQALQVIHFLGIVPCCGCSSCRQCISKWAWLKGREVGWDSGWRTHVHPWLIDVKVWQKPLQYCKVISLQLNKLIKKTHKILFTKLTAWFTLCVDPCSGVWVRVYISGYVYAYKTNVLFTNSIVGTLRWERKLNQSSRGEAWIR